MNLLKQEALEKDGWCVFECDTQHLEDEALAIARTLGEPVASRRGGALVDRIVPQAADSSHPRSLTSQHGLGSFPLHIDTAHWLTPCHFIILACEAPGASDRPTELLDSRDLRLDPAERSVLETEPMRIINGRYSFYSTVLAPFRPFIRYDPGCMTATRQPGLEAISMLAKERWTDRILEVRWKAGDVLVVDNWRMMHGRGVGTNCGAERKLIRVAVA